MKSSRQRFTEFRDKIRNGLLEPIRYRDPKDTRDIPSHGGRHGGPPEAGGGKHVFKHKKRQLFAEYRIMLQGYYGPLVGLLLLTVLGTVLALSTPVALRYLIDYVGMGKSLYTAAEETIRLGKVGAPLARWLAPMLPRTAPSSLNFMALILSSAAVLAVGLEWLRLLANQRLNYRLAGTLRQRLHNHMSRLSLAQLADYKTGGIVSRIMGDTDQVIGGIQNAILIPFNAILRIGSTLVLLIATDWRLSVGAALLIPPVLVIHFLLFRRLRPMWRNIQDDRSLLSARLTDMFGGIRVVRSFRRERSEAKEFGASQDTMIRKQQFTAILGRFLGTGWGIFVPAIGVLIVWYGGQRVLDTLANPQTPHPLRIGELVMFQTLIIMLLQPITAMIDSFQNLQQNLGALDRVIDVLDRPTDMPDRPGAIPLLQPRGELEFRGVTFGYSPDKQVLHNVSLQVPAGTMLAIVGPSGSGKTTMVNLVARFFDVTQGAILCDGHDIRDLQRESYRASFAMVLQDVYLFDGTVADNIAYGRRHATRDEVIAAAQRANAHEFIRALAQGYDTLIGERGNKLSGGQKQRLSIARAILADPKVLILDEATSSLDTHSEKMIQESLRQLLAGRTTLVIAHRLSTIMHADRIVVLVEGQIVEQGTHEELLDRHGVYHAMFTQQFQQHRDPNMERIEWDAPTAGAGV